VTGPVAAADAIRAGDEQNGRRLAEMNRTAERSLLAIIGGVEGGCCASLSLRWRLELSHARVAEGGGAQA